MDISVLDYDYVNRVRVYVVESILLQNFKCWAYKTTVIGFWTIKTEERHEIALSVHKLI